MAARRVDYDQIAQSFEDRYVHGGGMPGVQAALLGLAREDGPRRALEVGCGTAHWIGLLRPMVRQAVGLDLFLGMLRQGRKHPEPLHLVQGRAEGLPFRAEAFDLVFCVNALHHFDDPGCLMLHDHADAAALWFHDRDEEKWHERDGVIFVSAEPSPMGYGLAARASGAGLGLSFSEATALVQSLDAERRGAE